MEKAWGPVSQVRRAAAASPGLRDFVAMDFPFFRLLDPGQCDPRGVAPRIDFERHLFSGALCDAAILEPDHKGLDAMHHGAPAREQQPRPFGRAGHQGLLVSIEHQDHLVILSCLSPRESPLTGRSDALLSAYRSISSRQGWKGLLSPEHRLDPCEAFNPGRHSFRLKKRP